MIEVPLTVDGLHVEYGSVRALRGVSMEVFHRRRRSEAGAPVEVWGMVTRQPSAPSAGRTMVDGPGRASIG